MATQVVSSLQFIMTVDPLVAFRSVGLCKIPTFACGSRAVESSLLRGCIHVLLNNCAEPRPTCTLLRVHCILLAYRAWLGSDHRGLQFFFTPTVQNHGQWSKVHHSQNDYSADSLISRATRVWLVKDEECKESVLKDVWMDTDRLPEHEILRVFKRMKIDDMDDTTPRMMNDVFDLVIETSAPSSSRSSHPGESTSSQPVRNPGQMQMEDPQKLTIRSKYHYRTVFEEHGTDLYGEMSLPNVFKTLSDLVDALDIIHTSGWVHREISCGNVYWLHDPVKGPRGIIGDFEYGGVTIKRNMRNGRADPPKQAVFAHNPLHDLESLWWLLVYILLHRDDKVQAAQDFGMRNRNASALFKTGPDSVTRGAFKLITKQLA
ncbi:hypothetical protein D9757_013299 [Collybiopsis confluens]|uniref:Fungal-type protein kinase domain-containing protein n=1 Tax=Collybiopsis confluens TaxID=2823264 RepID=A0A8H5CPZ5_9AGAR|nr:hypothetical protein D9757_013299 [Collybiopsis confluens]